jgi:hypothetical protein
VFRTLWRALALLVPLAVAPLGAQIIRMPKTRDPLVWTSLSIGYAQTQALVDGVSNSVWNFGSTAQYRASIEKGIANRSSIGVSGSLARMPLAYQRYDVSKPGATACDNGCDAHATVYSLGVVFHSGGSVGFHQVIDASAGATRYENFRLDQGNTPVEPLNGDTDFSFVIGYGFGYSPSDRLEYVLVQDYGLALHQKTGLKNSSNNSSAQYVTRIGVRLGLGNRKPGV